MSRYGYPLTVIASTLAGAALSQAVPPPVAPAAVFAAPAPQTIEQRLDPCIFDYLHEQQRRDAPPVPRSPSEWNRVMRNYL